MAEFYIGQIMMTGFGYAQRMFALANGQTMSIAQNQALFALFGTVYGGNGVSTFQLPNLMGRPPMGQGASADPGWQPSPMALGQVSGAETVTLTSGQMPQPNHPFQANTSPGTAAGNPITAHSLFPQAAVQGGSPETVFVTGGNLVPLANQTVGMTGGNQPHNNIQPTRVINFNVALQGVWPSRN